MGNIGTITGVTSGNRWRTSQLPAADVQRSDPRMSMLHISLTIIGLAIFVSLTSLFGVYRTAFNGLSVTILVLTIVIILLKNAELRANPFAPFSMVLIVLAVTYGFRAITLEALRLRTDFAGSPITHLALACILVSVAVALCYAGYSSRMGHRLAQALPLFSFENVNKRPGQLVARAYFLFFIGMAARAVLIGHGIIHFPAPVEAAFLSYASYLNNLGQFAILSFVGVSGLALGKKASWVWVVPLLIGNASVGFLMGEGSGPFMGLVYLVLLYSFYVKPLRWRYVIGGTLLLLFVLAPLSMVWKSSYESELKSAPLGAAAVWTSIGQTMSNPDLSSARMTALGRFGELDLLLSVLDRVPRIYPYQKGHTFIPYLIQFPVPRFLWPSKLLVHPGREFAIKFADDPDLSDWGTSVAIGLVGELYYNFSYFGLLLCPIFGAVIRFLWERWKYYLRAEPSAATRFPYIFAQTLILDFSIFNFCINLILGPLLVYIFMVLFYGRLPIVRWLRPEIQRLTPGQ